MDLRITEKEENLLRLEAAIPAGEKFYVWCYDEGGHCIATSCPEEGREALEKAFHFFGCEEKALAYSASARTVPLVIGSPIGMQWAIAFEPEREHKLLFVMGPVFFSTPIKSQIRAVLHPSLSGPEDAVWEKTFIEQLSGMPVIPFAIFIRYVTMVHNVLTGRQLDVNVLLVSQDSEDPRVVPKQEKRDRTKVYLAERALLQMVRNGDINYQDALNMSSSLSPGVPVRGRGPLQQIKISIIVFTSLVCRAAIEGGMSPEEAYSLGDSYIETAVNSNDTGELNNISLSMYHDFIDRVHRLNSNPDYSLPIKKCCDYIQLSLDKKISLAEMASLTGYTEYYLAEKFKQETGMPLFLYIRCAKVERAKLLLESTDESVKEISEQLSFTTPNYFAKCFREIVGCTPAQYRKQFQHT